MSLGVEIVRQLPSIIGSTVLLIGALVAAWVNLKGRIAENTAEVVRGNKIAEATKQVADDSHAMMNSRFDQWKAETLKAATDAAATAAAAAYKQGIADAKAEAELAAAKLAAGIAAAATKGKPGEQGPTGPQGERGEQGKS